MLFRRKAYVDLAHRYPTLCTYPNRYTSSADMQWTYEHMREAHHIPIPFGSIIRLEDTSVFHRFFIGRISKVIAQYENALIVRVVSVSHDSKDPSPPPCVQLTLPMGIIQLNLRGRISRRYLEARDRLHAHCPPTPASLRKELAEFEEAESSDSGTHNFGGEILKSGPLASFAKKLVRSVHIL
ncbi:hypothetical protein EDD22DRAFT_956995 [Suillus occidentalis]|nr:hypothetical protein EDD22DRAFT_956995 [Suillus occidentalis]